MIEVSAEPAEGVETVTPVGVAPAAAPPPWRKRHPLASRIALYGLCLAVVATLGVLWERRRRADDTDRQDGFATKLMGLDTIVAIDPEAAIRIVEQEILPNDPAPDIRLQAYMKLATAHEYRAQVEKDVPKRQHAYGESERWFREAEGLWPSCSPKGLLYVPWANMLVSAERPSEALAMLGRSGATDGWVRTDDVDAVRERATTALAKKTPATPAPSAEK